MSLYNKCWQVIFTWYNIALILTKRKQTWSHQLLYKQSINSYFLVQDKKKELYLINLVYESIINHANFHISILVLFMHK